MVTTAVCPRVLGGRQCSLRVDVNRGDMDRAGPDGSKSKDPRSRANVGHTFTGQIESADKGCKEFAGYEPARVKDRRSDNEPETGRPRYSRRTAFQDQMI